MSIIKRHTQAPYRPREELDGTLDLEVDFNTFITEFNGGIEDVNIAADANLSGSKIATLPNAKIMDGAITTEHQSQRSFTSTDATNDTMTTDASPPYIEVPSISAITITPRATADILVCTFSAVWTTTLDAVDYLWSFEIDGTQKGALHISHGETGRVPAYVHYTYFEAGFTADVAIEVKPIYLQANPDGVGTSTFPTSISGLNITNKVLSVYTVPS